MCVWGGGSVDQKACKKYVRHATKKCRDEMRRDSSIRLKSWVGDDSENSQYVE